MYCHNPRIVTTGLKALMDAKDPKCYSGSGTNVINLVDPSNNFTLVTPTYNPEGYFTFDGSGERDGDPAGDYITFPYGGFSSIDADAADGTSYEWWQYTEAQTYGQCILHGNTTINHVEIKNEDTTSPYFRTEARLDNNYPFGTGTIPNGALVGRWAHFCLVFNNSESPRKVYWYHNGSLFHTHSDFDNGANTTNEYFIPYYFGRATGTTQYVYSQSFKGHLSVMAFYTIPLTAAQVLQNFRAKKSRYGL